MGPVLKTLLGLYLFLWTVIGILVIAGSFVIATKLPELKENLGDFSQLFETLPGSQNTGLDNQTPAGVTAEMQACVEEALGKETMQKLKSQTNQPSAAEQQAFEKCGFQPTTDQSAQGAPAAGQTGTRPTN